MGVESSHGVSQVSREPFMNVPVTYAEVRHFILSLQVSGLNGVEQLARLIDLQQDQRKVMEPRAKGHLDIEIAALREFCS